MGKMRLGALPCPLPDYKKAGGKREGGGLWGGVGRGCSYNMVTGAMGVEKKSRSIVIGR